jgi:peptidoglycan/xylan/chitin deacetylase (PgdA/CDA1 family)
LAGLAGRALAVVIRFGGLAWLVRMTIARRWVSIVIYHDPDPTRLDSQLAWLRRRYSLISLDRLAAALRSGRWAELPPRSLVVTVDDGHARNHELLDLFRRHQLAPAVYLCSQIVDSRRGFWFSGLDRDELERLKGVPNAERLSALERDRGFRQTAERPGEPEALSRHQVMAMTSCCEVGSHSRFHPILPRCSEEEARREIVDSKRELEQLTGRSCRHFAYPGGAYDARERALVERAGYLSARTVDIGWNRSRTDPYRLRVLAIDPPSITALAAELSGLKWLARLIQGKGGISGRRRFRAPAQPWTAP